MGQIVRGITLGSPGPVGSAAILFLYGQGPPTDNTDANVAVSRIGSLYTDYTAGNLWLKTATDGWTQIALSP